MGPTHQQHLPKVFHRFYRLKTSFKGLLVSAKAQQAPARLLATSRIYECNELLRCPFRCFLKTLSKLKAYQG